eukprot:31336-Pelagococcus_subviridis.AAC.13
MYTYVPVSPVMTSSEEGFGGGLLLLGFDFRVSLASVASASPPRISRARPKSARYAVASSASDDINRFDGFTSR